MDLTLSPSEEQLRDEVRSWLEANHPGPEPDELDEVIPFRQEWQRKLDEQGYAGISWPKEYGGRGATLIEQAIFNEEMARSKTPSLANVLGLVMGGPVVIAHGTDEQKQRYLKPTLTAEESWCPRFARRSERCARSSLRPGMRKRSRNSSVPWRRALLRSKMRRVRSQRRSGGGPGGLFPVARSPPPGAVGLFPPTGWLPV